MSAHRDLPDGDAWAAFMRIMASEPMLDRLRAITGLGQSLGPIVLRPLDRDARVRLREFWDRDGRLGHRRSADGPLHAAWNRNLLLWDLAGDEVRGAQATGGPGR